MEELKKKYYGCLRGGVDRKYTILYLKHSKLAVVEKEHGDEVME